ncbi:MAG: hypothetical protein ACXABD_18385 [Candidatus Thorarchaeota archaeon]|jgi:hypothetical protein
MQLGVFGDIFLYNAIVGLILFANVIVIIYLRKVQDERYMQVLTKAGRNSFLFLMIVLPYAGALPFLGASLIECGYIIFSVWIASLVVLYCSGFYYYTR